MSFKPFGADELRFHSFCWVCNTPFGPSVKEERHHLIPRAYGGVNGPQVSLCDSHHTALHNIALRLFSHKPFSDLLTHVSSQDEKLLYLAQIVFNARLRTQNDPNKRRVEILNLSSEVFSQLKQLQTVYPLSRPKLIEQAIKQLYARHFKS